MPLALLLSACLCSSPIGAPPPPRLAQLHLALDLALDVDLGSLSGRATLTVENRGIAPEARIPLHLGRLMTVTAVRDHRGRSLPFEQDVIRLEDWAVFQLNQVYVTLAEPLMPGDSAAVEVAYEGILVPYTETGMLYVRDRIAPDFSILRAESLGFPVLGVPRFKDSRTMWADDFTVRARITVPEGLTVATGFGPDTVESVPGGRAWVFGSPAPIPFFNVAVAPYAELAGARARIFHFPEDSLGARRVQRAVDAATGLYEEWFGPGPEQARVTIIEIPEGWGSQAHVTAGIMQTADAFRAAGQLPQLYHELAHLWHPQDLERPAPRWNEGLASFLQYRVAETLDDPGSLEARIDATVARALQMSEESPVPLADLGTLGLTGRAYSVGAIFFYLLYREMGADVFDDALAEWMATYRADGGDTADLVEILTRHGSQGTRRIVEEWMLGVEWHEALREADGVADLVERYSVGDRR